MLVLMNVRQLRLRPNNLEKAAYAMLDEIGVEYERQYLIGGKFCVDAFVTQLGTVIQFDGDYWHGNTDKFPVLSDGQKRRIHLDRSQDAYMKACGFLVVRIWESDIKKRRDNVKEELLDLLRARREEYPSPLCDQDAC